MRRAGGRSRWTFRRPRSLGIGAFSLSPSETIGAGLFFGASMVTTSAEYQRNARALAAARGRCSTCRARTARDGLRTCEYCGDKDRRVEGRARQRLWRECCQSTEVHRFDCEEAPKDKRGKG